MTNQVSDSHFSVTLHTFKMFVDMIMITVKGETSIWPLVGPRGSLVPIEKPFSGRVNIHVTDFHAVFVTVSQVFLVK